MNNDAKMSKRQSTSMAKRQQGGASASAGGVLRQASILGLTSSNTYSSSHTVSNASSRKSLSFQKKLNVEMIKMTSDEYSRNKKDRKRAKMMHITDNDSNSINALVKRARRKLSSEGTYLETPIIPFLINNDNHSLVVNNKAKITLGKSNPSLQITSDSNIPEEALRLQLIRVPTLVFQLPHRQHNIHLNGKKLNVDPQYWYSLPNSPDEPFEFNLDGSSSKSYAYNVTPLLDVECIPDNKNPSLSPVMINLCQTDVKQKIIVKKFDIPSETELKCKEEIRSLNDRIGHLERKNALLKHEHDCSTAKIQRLLESATIYCAICQGIIVNAVTVACKSQHAFCETCLDGYFEAKANDRVVLRNKPKRIIGECPSCRQTILNVNNKRSNDIDSTIIDFIQSGVIDNRDVVNDFFDNGGGEPFSVKEKEKILSNCNNEFSTDPFNLSGDESKSASNELHSTTYSNKSIGSNLPDSLHGTLDDPIVL